MSRSFSAAGLVLAAAAAFAATACDVVPSTQQPLPEPDCFSCRPDAGRPDAGEGGGGGGGAGGTGGLGGDGGGEGGGTGIALRLDNVRPRRGPTDGGASVVLNGAGFVLSVPPGVDAGDVTEVFFGGNAVIGVRVIDDDTILVPTPPGAPGDTDVLVRNPYSEAICAGCYRYQAPIELTQVEPSEGPLGGGQAVTVRGTNLRAGMQVTFGARAALDVALAGDGSLTVLSPPGDVEGPVDVRVFDGDGQADLRKSFTYLRPLRIERVEPPGGPLGGGNRVVVHGGGFTAGARLKFGGVEAAAQLAADGSLTAQVPPGAAPGPVEVEVETATGASSRAGAYAYFDPAERGVNLYAVSPARGPLGGGGTVTLVGTGLDGDQLTVRFGDRLSPAAVANNGNFVQAEVPAGAAVGLSDVSVRVAAGGASLPAAYRYVVPITVGSVTPATGPATGGTAITVGGSGFPAGAQLFIGALPATQLVVVDGSTLTAATPRGSGGPVPVRVLDPADPESEALLPDGFTYEGDFSLALLSPESGARAGGTRVTLLGSGFGPGLTVAFGETQSDRVEVESPYVAVAYAPRGEVGTVDVTAQSQGRTATLQAAFSYFDPTNAYGGSSGGPLAGTLNVTVLDGGNVRFGVPLPDSLVILGADDGSTLQGLTDDRGQLTFSDPGLVKAQVVTASLEGYIAVTVVNQESENLTVYLSPNVEPAECDNGLDDDGDGLRDFDGDGDPALADLDGCQCGPDHSPLPDLCQCPMMPMEFPGCCNGIDDDGDGLFDSEDPECGCTGGASEGPLTQCADCIDNDGDGSWDFQNLFGPPDPGCAGGGDDDERGAIVSGRVFGFKRPTGRVLGPNEVEVAYVTYSVRSVYNAPPWSSGRPQIAISRDGGTYAFEFASDQLMAMYAVYGIVDTTTNAFEPLLMGVRRGVNATTARPVIGADITLDMHLDLQVPVTIENPPVYGGAAGLSTVYAYLDLGQEGVIPVGEASTGNDHALLTRLPVLGGENFVFQLWGNLGGANIIPLTVTFRRQAGDLSLKPDGSGGITMGPLMGLTRILEPSPVFGGVIEWVAEGGPVAELGTVQIDEITMAGPVLQWQMVVPGDETRIQVPQEVVDMLRVKYADQLPMSLQLTLITGREPRFSFDQWNYTNLGLDSFTSFTYDAVELVIQ